ncbi:YecA family protein [Deinococcus aestuarii]|uniref:YecA family protein n=1 Tax=Deinococcus aestuarii TaxID=2774531 RepID=UPI001C0A96EC|nr:SEC-C domain-containing protein [Deinococcus aestuarii]
MARRKKKRPQPFNPETHHRWLAEQHGTVEREVQALVDRIADSVRAHAPLDLLAKCHLYMGGVRAGKLLESQAWTDDVVALRLPEYVQSVIVGTQPTGSAEIIGETFKELVGLVEKLYVKLTLEYAVTGTAARRQDMQKYSQPLDSLRTQQHMRWLAVRGQRYIQHDFEFLRRFLTGHSAQFERMFGMGAEEIVAGLEKLNASLSGGAFDDGTSGLREEWMRRYMAAVEEIGMREAAGDDGPYPTPEELADQISQELGVNPLTPPDPVVFTARATSGAPFDVLAVTGLPEALISRLALAPGEAPEFFSGNHPGWPDQRLPVMSRPFLRLGKRYYAFETATFFDHIYHNLREAVTGGNQGLEKRWEKQQQQDTEQAALDVLEELLPGATRQGAYYYEYLDEASGETRFAEADGYLLYARHLVLVEVKGGRASHRAPSERLSGYLNAMGRVTADPVDQAARFLKELARTGEVVLRDQHRNSIGTLKATDFDRPYVVAVTLDYVGDVTANPQGQTVLRVGQDHPAWIVNFGDLWITRDLVAHPVQFLHFLDQRAAAQRVPVLQVHDELHHLALYFRENRYAGKYARESRADRIFIAGVTDDFDAYYRGLPGAARPGQHLPPLFGEIVTALAASTAPEHVRAGKYLLDLPFDVRAGLEGRLHSLTQGRTGVGVGGDRPLTLFARPAGSDDTAECRKYALATMRVAGDAERHLLRVTLDGAQQVAGVTPTFLTQADVAAADPDELQPLASRLAAVVLPRAARVGRNQPCPCGSGRKFKKCCGSPAPRPTF